MCESQDPPCGGDVSESGGIVVRLAVAVIALLAAVYVVGTSIGPSTDTSVSWLEGVMSVIALALAVVNIRMCVVRGPAVGDLKVLSSLAAVVALFLIALGAVVIGFMSVAALGHWW